MSEKIKVTREAGHFELQFVKSSFTFRMVRYEGRDRPFFYCDTEGCNQSFPAGRIEHDTKKRVLIENGVGKWVEIPTYKFIFDENGGPCMNGEVLNDCPYC